MQEFERRLTIDDLRILITLVDKELGALYRDRECFPGINDIVDTVELLETKLEELYKQLKVEVADCPE